MYLHCVRKCSPQWQAALELIERLECQHCAKELHHHGQLCYMS